MRQMTEEQAIDFYESNAWKNMTSKDIVDLQLYQRRLCVPFSRFHEAIEEVLGRPVFTHEFAYDGIKDEYEKKCGKPSLEDILNLIPEDKRLFFFVR